MKWSTTALFIAWAPRAPVLISLLFAGVALADLLHFALSFRPRPVELRVTAAVTSQRRQTFDLQQIVRGHLFGVDLESNAVKAREPQLAWALSGVIASDDPKDGYAIIGEKGKSARLYRLGDDVAGGAGGRIHQILADRVVLDFGGHLETLRLPQNIKPGGLRTLMAPTSIAAAAAPMPGTEGEQLKPPLTAAESWFNNLEAERQEVDGVTAGMVLHPQKHMQRQYGFREGDIVTSVNGIEITDPDALSNALNSASSSMSLTYTRNGVQQTMNVSVNN